MANTLRFTVPAEVHGYRLDKALATILDVSRNEARALVDQGVTVDGVTGRPRDRVAEGSVIETPTPSSVGELVPEAIPLEIAYEDGDVIVVNKPPGLVVHPGSGVRSGTLAAGLLHRYPELDGVGTAGRWGIVHRLDKDTSGVLIVGRNQPSFEALVEQLRRREISRLYLALVSGLFQIPTGTIDAPIGRDPARPMRRAVTDIGKPATTHYEVLESFTPHGVTLLEIALDTGRTHQIRVHLEAIGHHVIGDPMYGPAPSSVSAPRVFLHAHRVEFNHPRSGDRVVVEASLPDDLAGVLRELGEMDIQ